MKINNKKVFSVKIKNQSNEGIIHKQQRLIFTGKMLKDYQYTF